MKFFQLPILLLFIINFISCREKSDIITVGTKYENGNWYDGDKFVRQSFFEIDGYFSSSEPDSLINTVDLKNSFVIPPFASAHNHNLDRDWQMSFLPQQYLDEGTFYYQALTSRQKQANALRPIFEKDATLDVKFAQQGFTSTLGHPFMAYEPFAMGLTFEDQKSKMNEIRESRLEENNAYIFVDSLSQIEDKISIFKASNPDVAKIYLLDVENFETNNQTGKVGQHGLSKEVAKALVKRLKKERFEVYAHIENAADFKFATGIGVDCVAHMPGYDFNGLEKDKALHYVDDKSIRDAVNVGMKVIPTVAVSINRRSIKDSIGKVNFVKSFLRRYKDAGGEILSGSDMFNNSLSPEIDALYNLNVFSNAELLEILSKHTPQYIFPERKIGVLEEGYEASFLVLHTNPLENFKAIKDISFSVKKGIILPKEN